MPLPQAPGWWAKNWMWFVPVAIVAFLGIFVGFIALVVTVVFGAMKSSEPYKESLAAAVTNPQVQAELGTPIETGWMMNGTINTAGSTGNAALEIPISGPKGKGHISVMATKSAGAWNYSKQDVTIEGKPEPIKLTNVRNK